MLSKSDYEDYLQQISTLEARMSSVYEKCSHDIEDENIKGLCHSLSIAEERHARLVQKLVDLLTL